MDKQIPLTKIKESNPAQDELCNAQGIEEILQQVDMPKTTQVPWDLSENYRDAAKLLALLKQAVIQAEEHHKKGIKASAYNQDNTLTPNKGLLKPLPGLEYLEQLDKEEPI